METTLKKLSVESLDSGLKSYRKVESKALADIIWYLSELDLRGAYRELGYSSLYMYCKEALKYSDGSAYRRVQAAKCLVTNPEIYDLIKEGKVTLCAVSEVAKVKDEKNKTELLKVSEGKTQLEVQAMAAQFHPPQVSKKEKIKAKLVEVKVQPIFDRTVETDKLKTHITQYDFHVAGDEEFMGLYKEVKELVGNVPASEVLKRCMKEFIAKRTVVKRQVKVSQAKNSRFIPKSNKATVLKRDNGQCTFVSKDGKRCTERHGLQVDHVKPFALGGDNSVGNLRMLCQAHNLYLAEKAFGREKVRGHASRLD